MCIRDRSLAGSFASKVADESGATAPLLLTVLSEITPLIGVLLTTSGQDN